MKQMDKIIKDLEAEFRSYSVELGDDLTKELTIEVQVLGQTSLLMDNVIPSKISLTRTNDLDALVKGRSLELVIFRKVLKSNGLVLDELSSDIWIPKGASFVPYYDSSAVKVSYLDPISALVSKAVKAKEKNRVLISDALVVLGESLASKIRSNGGDIGYFTESQKRSL
jgi:hypothetical protein